MNYLADLAHYPIQMDLLSCRSKKKIQGNTSLSCVIHSYYICTHSYYICHVYEHWFIEPVPIMMEEPKNVSTSQTNIQNSKMGADTRYLLMLHILCLHHLETQLCRMNDGRVVLQASTNVLWWYPPGTIRTNLT